MFLSPVKNHGCALVAEGATLTASNKSSTPSILVISDNDFLLNSEILLR